MATPKIDMTGRQFRHWRVLRRSAKVTGNYESWWWCRCECGTVWELHRGSLINGGTSHCDLSTCTVRLRKLDLSGKKIGRLTVLRWAGDKWFLCRCECGKRKRVARYLLVRAMRGAKTGTYSCGCLWRERQYPTAWKHGHCRPKMTRTYQAYLRMKWVCDYTAPEFRTFRDFLDLMGEKPPSTRLQRHHPDAGFTPDNVEWVRWPKHPKRDRYGWLIRRRLNNAHHVNA